MCGVAPDQRRAERQVVEAASRRRRLRQPVRSLERQARAAELGGEAVGAAVAGVECARHHARDLQQCQAASCDEQCIASPRHALQHEVEAPHQRRQRDHGVERNVPHRERGERAEEHHDAGVGEPTRAQQQRQRHDSQHEQRAVAPELRAVREGLLGVREDQPGRRQLGDVLAEGVAGAEARGEQQRLRRADDTVGIQQAGEDG